MKRSIGIIVFLCLWCSMSLYAGEVSAESRQRFMYYFYAAEQAMQQNNYARAFMLFRFCEVLDESDGQTKEYLGMLYDALHDQHKSLRYFEQAYACNPKDLWNRPAQALYNNGSPAQKQAAVKMVEQATQAQPKDEDAWVLLQHMYVAEQRFKDALKAQDALDKITGYNAYSAYTRYQMNRLMGKNKQALKEVEKYVALEPRDAKFQTLKVQLYEQLGTPWKQLKEGYETVLALDPRNLMMRNNYAYGMAIHGEDLQKAEQMSRSTLQDDPENPVYLDTYAWILHLQGQDSLAAFYIRKAKENMGSIEDKEIERHYKTIIGK